MRGEGGWGDDEGREVDQPPMERARLCAGAGALG